ncbi:hypothetical protein DBA29_16230 [Xenophilus aerolatus]|nr:hypothetical protein [Xenophilus aerolatus]
MPPADPVLRRMLDAAPDRDAAPHPATREAILRSAHNAVAPTTAARPTPREAAPPWWRRLWGGTPGSRMPWNAAFATVMVALFVTVLWHREPVPDARLDAEAPAASPAAPAEGEPAPRADARAAREERRRAAEADTAAKQQATTKPAAKAQAESLAERREAPPPPAVAAPAAPITVPPVAEADSSPSPSPSPAGGGAPAIASAPPAAPRAAPAAPAPAAAARERASGDGTLAEPMAPPSAELAPAPAREAAAPPAALARRSLAPAAHPGAWRGWTHLRIVDASGQSRRLARAEAAQLGALVEAAVPSGGGAAALESAVPGWRIVLEGARGAALGVLEVPAAPGRTLRWSEGAAPPVAVEPPPAVLDALQRALAER